jgi:hypothetical protein
MLSEEPCFVKANSCSPQLHMGPPNRSPEDSVELKAPLYFYYSSCYYQHNRYRLGHRWQVRRGNTSWDIGISDLKYKGEPRLDIAILRPTEGTSDALSPFTSS